MSAAQDGPSKAQIEQREREQLGKGATTHRVPDPSGPGSDSGPTAWQLALGAALGAGLVGGVVVGVRQVSHHDPVASAH